MKLPNHIGPWTCLAGMLFLLLGTHALHPQSDSGHALQTTTQEHLETEDWWPTKSNMPLSSFAGSASCSRCHLQEVANQPSAMQRAAAPAVDSALMKARPTTNSSFHPLTYALAPVGGSLGYSVSDGAHKVSQKLDWVIGAGDLGRTFLYQSNGHWYQSAMTLYAERSMLDTTTGLDRDPSAALTAALGKVLSPQEIRLCFGCHTVHATTAAGLDPAKAEPGLGCEACHGPARGHVEAMTEQNRSGSQAHVVQTRAGGVFNPAKLSPADSIDFCGSCHRTFADAMLSTSAASSTAVVRFQPYRLEESKCWRATQDERLTCVSCHNPHEGLNRDANSKASYDKHCLSCHTTGGETSAVAHAVKVCPKATDLCVSCHMPKVAVASMHGEFTDHFIRVVRPEDGFPR